MQRRRAREGLRWVAVIALSAGIAGSIACSRSHAASGSGGSSGASTGGSSQAGAVPTLASTRELCKLINDTGQRDPTPNQAQTRANILGCDLGIPVAHDGTLYLFFGDTIGYEGIWPADQSAPDSVAFAADPEAAVANDPSLLCHGLTFLTLPPSESAGPGRVGHSRPRAPSEGRSGGEGWRTRVAAAQNAGLGRRERAQAGARPPWASPVKLGRSAATRRSRRSPCGPSGHRPALGAAVRLVRRGARGAFWGHRSIAIACRAAPGGAPSLAHRGAR